MTSYFVLDLLTPDPDTMHALLMRKDDPRNAYITCLSLSASSVSSKYYLDA